MQAWLWVYSPPPNSREAFKNRGLAIFPEEINGDGVNKWKWVDFVMQCLKRGVDNSCGGNINFFKVLLLRRNSESFHESFCY